MSTLPFSTFDLQTHEIEAMTHIFDNLKQRFGVSYDTNFTYDFSALEIFRNRKITPGPAIRITNAFQSFYLAFVLVGYSYAYGRRYSYGLTYEYQTWATIPSKKDFGHMLVQPETLLDKIHELINPVEIDFSDDPEFSRNFYVVSADETKARLSLNESIRKCIKNINVKDFIIEFLRDTIVIGNRKTIEVDSALSFAKFMDDLSKEI